LDNVLGLYEVGEFEKPMFVSAPKLIRITDVEG
jgi:hypothetical protein